MRAQQPSEIRSISNLPLKYLFCFDDLVCSYLNAGNVLRRNYHNNVVEQDHRNVKRRTWLPKGYGSLWTTWRTLRGIEAMDIVRTGRVRWVAKDDPVGQAKFISKVFAA